MTSVLQQIFGGGSSSQATQAQSTPTNMTNPALSNLAPGLATSLQSLLSSLTGSTNNANPTGGITPVTQAPVTAQEQTLLNQLPGQTGPGTASAGWINDVLAGKYLPGGANANPALAGTITAAQRPTLDNLTQTLTQALPGRFAAAGQSLQPNSPGSTGGGSSAFDDAAALAFQSAANTSTDIASNIANNEYNTGVQTQTTAAGLDQNEVNNTINALQASALPRLIQQNGLDQGLQLFQTQVSNLLQTLQTIGGVQAPVVANASESTGQGSSTTSKGIVPDLFSPAKASS